MDEHTRRLTAPAEGGTTQLVSVIRALDDAASLSDDVGLRRPTLDDVFIAHRARGRVNARPTATGSRRLIEPRTR